MAAKGKPHLLGSVPGGASTGRLHPARQSFRYLGGAPPPGNNALGWDFVLRFRRSERVKPRERAFPGVGPMERNDEPLDREVGRDFLLALAEPLREGAPGRRRKATSGGARTACRSGKVWLKVTLHSVTTIRPSDEPSGPRADW